MASLITGLASFLVFVTSLNDAHSFTPSHQEACCLAMQRQEPLGELRCDSLNLTPELCKSIVRDFSRAARMQLPAPPVARVSKPAPAIKWDITIWIFVTLLVAGVGIFFFKRRRKANLMIFRHLLLAGLTLTNAPLIFLFASLGLSKLSCLALGNLCETGTVLIPIFVVTGAFGALVSGRYLYRGWKTRMTALKANLFILIFLLLVALAAKIFSFEIP